MNIRYESKLMPINTKNIIIDELGQRDVEKRGAQFRKIIREFDPNLVQPISVALIDGKYYCFNGQMTMKVLKARNGGKDLYVNCMVYEGMTKHDAAILFTKQRGTEVKVTFAEKIQVLANYGDPDSVKFMRSIEAAGFRIDKRKVTGTDLIFIGASSQLWKEYKAFEDVNDFNDFLHVLKFGFINDPFGTNSKIIGGLGLFMRTYKIGEYQRADLEKALDKTRAVDIIRDAEADRSPGMRKYATKIFEAYNHGKKYKLAPRL